MKLSDKGWHKIVLAENLLDDPDFEQSDFEGAVVLSVKEAKRLDNLIERINDDIVLSDTEIVSWIILRRKIEQAEKENASN